MGRWLPLGVLVLAQVGYPLTGGRVRAGLVAATVLLGFAVSVGHAARTRGRRAAVVLLVATAAGGLAVEALGVHTGFPFGGYRYLLRGAGSAPARGNRRWYRWRGPGWPGRPGWPPPR